MKRLNIIYFLLIIILLPAACSDAVITPSETAHAFAAASPPTSPSSIVSSTAAVTIPTATPLPSEEPAITEETAETSEYRRLTDEAEQIGYGYTWDPLFIPEISDEDRNSFNTEKAMDYLLAAYTQNNETGRYFYLIHHDYSIESTEVKGGVLYLTITDNRYSDNANDIYKYLKETFDLTDDVIQSLPVLSGCYIYDGYMYASKSAWEARQEYVSIKDWEASSEDNDTEGDEVNLIIYSCVTHRSIPVADDALIMPLADDPIDQSLILSTQEYIDYLSNASNADETDHFFFKDSNVYVKYENRCITALMEIFVP